MIEIEELYEKGWKHGYKVGYDDGYEIGDKVGSAIEKENTIQRICEKIDDVIKKLANTQPAPKTLECRIIKSQEDFNNNFTKEQKK